MNGMDRDLWARLLAGPRDVVFAPTAPDDPAIRFAVVWKHEPRLLERLPNLKVIFSAGAGVDHLLTDAGLPDVPIVRVIDDSLTGHMVDYVVWRVTDHHRQGMLYRADQAARLWRDHFQPSAHDVSVGIMGLGNLGRAAARALVGLGYKVNGWSRSPQAVDGVTCHSGPDGLKAFLNTTDILVVLLPHTAATHGIIDHALLARLRRDNPLGGACLINAGRGKLQKGEDILRALDDGTLKEASLDVFEQEPLPTDSPFWGHPRVFITPHTAADSDPSRLTGPMLAQMDAFDRGEALTGVVDPKAGY
ncbi:MAG: glyoxylate/hydroxypyruvate reductase A [Mesorhizobium sp.]